MGRYTRSPENSARLAASRFKEKETPKVTETVTLTSTASPEPVVFEVPVSEPEVTYVSSVFSTEPVSEIKEGIVLEEAAAQEIEIEEVAENTSFNSYKRPRKFKDFSDLK